MNERTLRSIPEGVAEAINTETHAASRRNSRVHPVFAPILNAMSEPFAPPQRDDAMRAYHDDHRGWADITRDIEEA